MQRFKFYRKPIVLIVALSSLFISVFKSESDKKGEQASLTKVTDTPPIDLKALKLYKEQQQELKSALDAYFKKAMASGELVGAGVSIVLGDSILVSDGFGKRNIKLNDAVDGETVFRLGSLSKGFAGVLAARLKHEGLLQWSDKVSDFIPEFQLGNHTTDITLANILSHTSGVPYHSYTNLVEAGLPLTEIAKRFKQVTPISKPGKMYSYQNAMFALSGEMMYKVTNQDISSLLNAKFFKPLDMNSVSMDNETLTHTENVALPHSKRYKRWYTLKLNKNYYNAIAAGGINASALDMAKWMRLLLGHRPEIMDKSALAEAFNPFIEIKGISKYYQRWPGHVSSYYGFGWRIHNFMEHNEQKTMYHHGGSVNNYRNEIALFPDADLGICVLMNNNSKLSTKVIPDLYKMVNTIFKDNHSNSTVDHLAEVDTNLD